MGNKLRVIFQDLNPRANGGETARKWAKMVFDRLGHQEVIPFTRNFNPDADPREFERLFHRAVKELRDEYGKGFVKDVDDYIIIAVAHGWAQIGWYTQDIPHAFGEMRLLERKLVELGAIVDRREEKI